jgi:hypothetical protein
MSNIENLFYFSVCSNIICCICNWIFFYITLFFYEFGLTYCYCWTARWRADTQFPLLESFWDNKHRTRLIAEQAMVSVVDWFYVFYWFHYYVVVHGANIYVLLLCSTTFAPAQDLHAQPLDVWRAVRAVHMSCGVPAAFSACQPRSADDGQPLIGITHGPLVSRDPHVLPSVWRDHDDTTGRCHDSWSSHWWHSCLWAGVSCRVEGLCRIGYWPSTLWHPTPKQGWSVQSRIHMRCQHRSIDA